MRVVPAFLENHMTILFAASEMTPFCKTGGLADMIGSLAPVLASMGHDVHVVLPGYAAIDRKRYGFNENCGRFQVPVGPVTKPVSIASARWDGVTVHLIENEEYFDRPGLYGDINGDYFDNGPRFVCYARAVLEAAKCLGLKPAVIHAHDWQAGLVMPYLSMLYARDEPFRKTRTLFTIHNLGYQGVFAPWVFGLSGIPETEFNWLRMEYYGNVSFLKSGIVYSDAVSTVSPTYAREITTEPLGFGLQGVLANRAEVLHGILNGIDAADMDPSTDPVIPERYSASDMKGKAACRRALVKAFGLDASAKYPVFGMVTRLDRQKGLDIVGGAIERLTSLGIRLVVLGSGDRGYVNALESFAARHPGLLGLNLRFDPEAARLVYAGADAFLMPSMYEPCGLGQMFAMRYGTLPVVHATGGLADTVVDLDAFPDTGNGFSFNEFTSDALVEAAARAVKAFSEPKRARWNSAVSRGMAADFSWKKSAEAYEALYRELSKKNEV